MRSSSCERVKYEGQILGTTRSGSSICSPPAADIRFQLEVSSTIDTREGADQTLRGYIHRGCWGQK